MQLILADVDFLLFLSSFLIGVVMTGKNGTGPGILQLLLSDLFLLCSVLLLFSGQHLL